MRIVPGLGIGVFLLLAASSFADGVSYDAASNQLPQDPPFTRMDIALPWPVNGYNAPQSVSGGVYRMGPTDVGKYTFWYTDDLVLDHTRTVEVSARLRVISSSSTADRAGLSLGLTDDRNLYQVLYITPTEAFNNKDGRLRDQAYALDATQWHDYLLRLQGDTVTVEIDGVERMSGTVFQANDTLGNWAVVGDIASAANTEFEMTRFSVSVTPEPAGLLLVAIGALALGMRRRSKS